VHPTLTASSPSSGYPLFGHGGERCTRCTRTHARCTMHARSSARGLAPCPALSCLADTRHCRARGTTRLHAWSQGPHLTRPALMPCHTWCPVPYACIESKRSRTRNANRFRFRFSHQGMPRPRSECQRPSPRDSDPARMEPTKGLQPLGRGPGQSGVSRVKGWGDGVAIAACARSNTPLDCRSLPTENKFARSPRGRVSGA
jgi:hypothetical protein